MNIYLSSTYSSKLFLNTIKKVIENSNSHNSVVSDWLTADAAENVITKAASDFCDIDNCDMLVAFYPYGYGTISEMAYAMGQKKFVIYVVDDYFNPKKTGEPLICGLLEQFDPKHIHTSWPKYGFIVNNLEDVVYLINMYRERMYE